MLQYYLFVVCIVWPNSKNVEVDLVVDLDSSILVWASNESINVFSQYWSITEMSVCGIECGGQVCQTHNPYFLIIIAVTAALFSF